ncbi:MAG: redoxin domain-containing protein [Planctomycetes bacterium]|nr:redoxin domain-containing protein [Planctomycetota bacterium]
MSEPVRAPELESPHGWLNTDRPLRLAGELRGQVVVLDFWTYCCINCMHILPDLAYLEHKYGSDPVTFIGVHSAKFANEAARETIRAAILRYEIKHPVVIDDRMRLWRAYAVRSWPTLVVIDPRGYVVAVAAGEGNREIIDAAIAQTLEQARVAGALATGPLSLRREGSVRAASGLAFPGKVLADANAGRLFVADSNHNRVVIARLPDDSGRAEVLAVVGTGAAGRNDGPSDRATFNHPQGLASAHGRLYVADTENHLIRAVDLTNFEVTTIVGTGEMCNDRAGGGMGTEQGLNSPWDLTIEGLTLYVAMAGTHQIWRIDLPVGFARALAGTGRENLADGPTETAALAQPSGICTHAGNLFFADSEVSAIRGIDMATERVFTVIGEGLFAFGDVDGVYPQARLQHPLGVASWKASLLVADTYNHKIKVVDPGGRSAKTLYGTGAPGTETPGYKPAFNEPGGLSVAGDKLYIADTNNHRIVRIDLLTQQWCEVVFDGLAAPRAVADTPVPEPQSLRVPPVALAAGREIELHLEPALPPGAHWNAEAHWSARVTASGRALLQKTGTSRSLPITLLVPAGCVPAREETWHVQASFAWCMDSQGGVCVPAECAWTVPVRCGGTATAITLRGE